MNIKVYSDASFVKGVGKAVSIILGDGIYLGMVIGSYNTESPSETELQGVLQSLKYIKESKLPVDKIDIYTDLNTTSDVSNRILRYKTVPLNLMYRGLWLEIADLLFEYDARIHPIKGHQEDNNPNKACDRLSRLLLKRDYNYATRSL